MSEKTVAAILAREKAQHKTKTETEASPVEVKTDAKTKTA